MSEFRLVHDVVAFVEHLFTFSIDCVLHFCCAGNFYRVAMPVNGCIAMTGHILHSLFIHGSETTPLSFTFFLMVIQKSGLRVYESNAHKQLEKYMEGTVLR